MNVLTIIILTIDALPHYILASGNVPQEEMTPLQFPIAPDAIVQEINASEYLSMYSAWGDAMYIYNLKLDTTTASSQENRNAITSMHMSFFVFF